MILGGCLPSPPGNLCDCEQDCWATPFATADEYGACTAACAATGAACNAGCNSDFTDAEATLNTANDDCQEPCNDTAAACEDACGDDDPDCLPGCVSAQCQCQNACVVTLYNGLTAPQNTQATCLSQCCTVAGGDAGSVKKLNLTYAQCQLAALTAQNTATNAALAAYYGILESTGCMGGDMTDAGHSLSVAEVQAGYTASEANCQCALANAWAQKVCAGLSTCACAAQKAWDDGDIACTTGYNESGDADALTACQNANQKQLWAALMICCFNLLGSDKVSPCVLAAAGARLDCVAAGTSGCDDTYTASAAACYAPPAVGPCSGCDALFGG